MEFNKIVEDLQNNLIDKSYLYADYKNGEFKDYIPKIVEILFKSNGNRLNATNCFNYIEKKIYPNIKPLTLDEIQKKEIYYQFSNKSNLYDDKTFKEFYEKITKNATLDENGNFKIAIEYGTEKQEKKYTISSLYEEFKMSNVNNLNRIKTAIEQLEQARLLDDNLLCEDYKDGRDLSEFLFQELPKHMTVDGNIQINNAFNNDINNFIGSIITTMKKNKISNIFNEIKPTLTNEELELKQKLMETLPSQMPNLNVVVFDQDSVCYLKDIVNDSYNKYVEKIKTDKNNKVGENLDNLYEINDYGYINDNCLLREEKEKYFYNQLDELKEAFLREKTINELMEISGRFQDFCKSFGKEFLENHRDKVEEVNEVIRSQNSKIVAKEDLIDELEALKYELINLIDLSNSNEIIEQYEALKEKNIDSDNKVNNLFKEIDEIINNKINIQSIQK